MYVIFIYFVLLYWIFKILTMMIIWLCMYIHVILYCWLVLYYVLLYWIFKILTMMIIWLCMYIHMLYCIVDLFYIRGGCLHRFCRTVNEWMNEWKETTTKGSLFNVPWYKVFPHIAFDFIDIKSKSIINYSHLNVFSVYCSNSLLFRTNSKVYHSLFNF
jgi:hypothetical protein